MKALVKIFQSLLSKLQHKPVTRPIKLLLHLAPTVIMLTRLLRCQLHRKTTLRTVRVLDTCMRTAHTSIPNSTSTTGAGTSSDTNIKILAVHFLSI